MGKYCGGRTDTLAPVVSTLRGRSSAPVAPAVPTPLQWRIEKFVLVGERSGGLGPAAGVYMYPVTVLGQLCRCSSFSDETHAGLTAALCGGCCCCGSCAELCPDDVVHVGISSEHRRACGQRRRRMAGRGHWGRSRVSELRGGDVLMQQ